MTWHEIPECTLYMSMRKRDREIHSHDMDIGNMDM